MLRLPEDVAISVQRILGMDSNSPDPFSSFDFSENHVISILNHLVPDGVHSEFDLPVPQLSHVWRPQRPLLPISNPFSRSFGTTSMHCRKSLMF